MKNENFEILIIMSIYTFDWTCYFFNLIKTLHFKWYNKYHQSSYMHTEF